MPADRADVVLPPLLELLKDDTEEDMRMLGLEVLDKVAGALGSEICQNYLVFELVSLQDDPVYRVRRETCKRLVGISRVINLEVFEGVIVPVFKSLCADHIWGVRRQAVEVLP